MCGGGVLLKGTGGYLSEFVAVCACEEVRFKRPT